MNKTLWWVVGGVVAVILVVWLVKGPGSNPYASPSPSLVGEVPVTSPASGVGPVAGKSGTAAYTQLVTQYATARIQFDQDCQAKPTAPVYKNGTRVMFDNRSGDARTITINGTDYHFPGYGYWLITLRSSTLPKTISLNCGSATHVGTILLEK